MTRTQFIQRVNADLRAQRRQVYLLMGLIIVFGMMGRWLVNRGSDQLLRVGSPELWLLLALTVLITGVAVFGLRLTGRALLRCPHCRRYLGGLPAQVVVGCGCCGFCGGRIIDELEKG